MRSTGSVCKLAVGLERTLRLVFIVVAFSAVVVAVDDDADAVAVVVFQHIFQTIMLELLLALITNCYYLSIFSLNFSEEKKRFKKSW